jgi:hypothetical protein
MTCAAVIRGAVFKRLNTLFEGVSKAMNLTISRIFSIWSIKRAYAAVNAGYLLERGTATKQPSTGMIQNNVS